MHRLVVLGFCTVSLAIPQGYNYNLGAAPGKSPAAGGFGGSFAAVGSAGVGVNLIQGGQSVHHSASFGGYQHSQQQEHQQEAVVSKRFFIHSAPEDNEEDAKEKVITVGVPKKNYNIVFIKSPSKSSKKNSIKISPAPNEEKTVIYVLSQKSEASDIQAEVIEQPSTTAKPEVFFIKYKTNEEANHARQQIQAQYDALGGTSQVTDEGVAPLTSVIGSLNANTSDGSNTPLGAHNGVSTHFGVSPAASSIHASGVAVPPNAYLPPNFF